MNWSNFWQCRCNNKKKRASQNSSKTPSSIAKADVFNQKTARIMASSIVIIHNELGAFAGTWENLRKVPSLALFMLTLKWRNGEGGVLRDALIDKVKECFAVRMQVFLRCYCPIKFFCGVQLWINNNCAISINKSNRAREFTFLWFRTDFCRLRNKK